MTELEEIVDQSGVYGILKYPRFARGKWWRRYKNPIKRL